ncbi:hypothetical protein IWW38_005578, partial [Coemansia aciculifera]
MSLSPDTRSSAGAVAPPHGSSISNIVDGTPPLNQPLPAYSPSISVSAVQASMYTEGNSSARNSVEGDDNHTDPPHIRSASNSSGVQQQQQHSQMSPHLSPYYNGRSSQSFHQPLVKQRRSSATGHGGDSTPPGIRYTQSDAHPGAKRGSFSGGSGSNSNNNGPAHGPASMPLHGSSGGGPDEGKNMYQLWLPWEETALVDWLYEPTNCKLFNEPRRKKE